MKELERNLMILVRLFDSSVTNCFDGLVSFLQLSRYNKL